MRSVYNWGRSRLRRPEKPVRKELLAFDTVVQKAKDFLRCLALHDWQLQNSRRTDLTKFCHVRLKSTMKFYNDTIEWRFLFLLPAWFCDDLKLGDDVRKSVTRAVTDACVTLMTMDWNQYRIAVRCTPSSKLSLSSFLSTLKEIHSLKMRSSFVKIWSENSVFEHSAQFALNNVVSLVFCTVNVKCRSMNNTYCNGYWENQCDHENCELLSASLLSKTNFSRSTNAFQIPHCQIIGFLNEAWYAESTQFDCGGIEAFEQQLKLSKLSMPKILRPQKSFQPPLQP